MFCPKSKTTAKVLHKLLIRWSIPNYSKLLSETLMEIWKNQNWSYNSILKRRVLSLLGYTYVISHFILKQLKYFFSTNSVLVIRLDSSLGLGTGENDIPPSVYDLVPTAIHPIHKLTDHILYTFNWFADEYSKGIIPSTFVITLLIFYLNYQLLLLIKRYVASQCMIKILLSFTNYNFTRNSLDPKNNFFQQRNPLVLHLKSKKLLLFTLTI